MRSIELQARMDQKHLFRFFILFILIFHCFIPNALSNHDYEHRRRRKVFANNTQRKTQASDQDPNFLKSVNVQESRKSFATGSQNPPDLVAPVPSDGKLLDAEVFKSLLKDLLSRIDSYSISRTVNNEATFPVPSAPLPSSSVKGNTMTPGGGNGEEPRHINSLNVRHCALHGLWLSTVAGAAIELIPDQQHGHIEIRTKIFELPDNPYPPLITSQWTGKGIISQESPTTLTIVFQEHIDGQMENNAKERNSFGDSSVEIQLPRTAVFVGQCLVCFGSPMLQGSWVVFPAAQTCSAEGGGGGMSPILTGKGKQRFLSQMNGQNSLDAIYLLRHY